MNRIILLGFLVCGSVRLGAAPIELWKPGDYSAARGGAVVQGSELLLPSPKASCSRVFKLDPNWRKLRLVGEMCTENVPGDKVSWRTARFAMEWRDSRGKTVSPWPMNIGWTGTTPWRRVEQDYFIPTNAASLSLALCNLSSGGVVRFRNVSLTVVRDHPARRTNAPLPAGVTDPESLNGAYRTTSSTRASYSLNGIWRCRPAFANETGTPNPTDNWAWAKIPSVWDQRRKPFVAADLAEWYEDHPEEVKAIEPLRAWYARKLTIPADARGKRVILRFDLLGSMAEVYANGKKVGRVTYPESELDLTGAVRPGEDVELAIDVRADATGETVEYNESRRKVVTRRQVKFAGVTGDVWLDVVPEGERLDFAWAETSVAEKSISFWAETKGLEPGLPYEMRAVCVSLDGKDRQSFKGSAQVDSDGRISFTAPWANPRLWDLDTPRNRYACRLAILRKGQVVDETTPFVFGFREVAIDGRDLRLNGRKVHLRALFDRTQEWNYHLAAYTNAVAKCRAAQLHGFNAMIAGNYSFGAGSMAAVEDLLNASDDTGFMYCFSLPHFKDFADLEKPEGRAFYKATTRRVMRLARRHPSVVLWATSHNAAGYLGAGHPQRIDGKYELPNSYNGENRRRARICREVIRELDPSRPCYHHESGNLDDFHCVNCYLNWSPIQEKCEWLKHWSEEGVKPLFFVEWGLPHISSWASYRGPEFIWRAHGYMSIWASEYAAAFRNDAAYTPDGAAKGALMRELALWRENPRGFTWGALNGACTHMKENYLGIQALYAADNWRSLRAWGITAALPWDQGGLYRPNGALTNFPVPISAARKRPGYTPDYLYDGWGDPATYVATPVGEVFDRWNQPDCAWIGGDGIFTDKRHIFAPSEAVKKQLVILNDRRQPQKVSWSVTFGGQSRSGRAQVEAGEKALVPIQFTAPKNPGRHTIQAEFAFEGGVRQTDAFAVEVVAPMSADVKGQLPVLVDTVGKTRAELKRLGITFREGSDPARGERLIIGRESLTKDLLRKTVFPHMRRGGRVVIFEQGKATLEEIGFRTQTYGLRRVFPRFRDGAYAGLMREELLRDWNGESTLERAYTPLREVESGSDGDMFAGYRVTRVWRNGFRGAVASVIPEKPSYGDWVPWVDGGFDLQYSPLLEWRLETGSAVFCQMDVTARTMPDVAADELVKLLCVGPQPTIRRDRGRAEPHGMLAYAATVYSPRRDWVIEQDHAKRGSSLFLVTSGAGKSPADFAERIKNGATALLLGLNGEEIQNWSPVPLKTEFRRDQMYSRIEKLPPELNGLSNADWAWHGFMDFTAFVDSDASGNAAVKVVHYGKGTLVFWQVPPWMFNAELKPYLRMSKRRAEFMLSRLMSNLGFRRGEECIKYADIPVAEDDPYRYYHW